MIETLLPFLLGEKSPSLLVDVAQAQLDVGRAAIANDPELATKAQQLFTQRAVVYADECDIAATLAQYDFTNVRDRFALAVTCLPEVVRERVLHDIYKGVCGWCGKTDAWPETMPGQMLLNGRERLRCKDSVIAVIEQALATIETCGDAATSKARVAEYQAALTSYLSAAFVEAQEQLEVMRTGFADASSEVLSDLRALLIGDKPAAAEESNTGAHPLAGNSVELSEFFRHPSLALTSETVLVKDWAARCAPADDAKEAQLNELRADYDMRRMLYQLPADEQIVLVEITAGASAGTQLLVHDSELAD